MLSRMARWQVEAAALLVAAGVGLAAGRADAVQDPTLRWWTIRTDHFIINYYDGLEPVALRVAAAAEEAHDRLTGVLGHEPKKPTEITITDEYDDSNGWALTVPYNQIRVYATAPNDMSTLSDYDDWYLGLVVHEYTHILHMDTYGGIAKVINAIFGKVYPPNSVQPIWVLEGYAVFEESDKTSGGRLRSTQWDMMMRAAVLEDHFYPLDTVSGGPLGWPHGTSIYLYGSYFIKWMVDRYGEGLLADVSHHYGKSLLPFGVNRTIRELTGRTWPELYAEWYAEMREAYGAQADAVRGEGLVEGMRITDTGEVDLCPRFSPDGGRIAFFSWDGHDRSGLYVMDVDPLVEALDDPPGKPPASWRPDSIIKTTGQGSLSWTPDGDGLVYARSEVWKNWYAFHDIYHVDLGDGSILRLTEGGRARQPDVSPDGELVAYTINGAGESTLAVARAEPEPEPFIVERAGQFSQVYSPRFSPDGRRIAYSLWTEGGRRSIHVLDVETGESRQVTSDGSLSTGPAWDPAGRYLYYCSDMTGISNVYALDLEDGSLWQVTNVLTGAFQPDVSPDGGTMVYVGYHARGYDLYLIELAPGTWRQASPPVDDGPEVDLGWIEREPELEPRRYNPLRTLYPRYWSFMIAEDEWGYALTLLTTGSDVAGHHAVSASVTTGLEGRLRVSYGIDYSLLLLPVDISLHHGRSVGKRWGLRIDDEWKTWTEVRYSGSVSVTIPLVREDWAQFFSISYGLAWMHSADPLDVPMDPNAALPRLPDRGLLSGLGLSWFFSNARGSHFGVSLEEGYSLWTSVHADLPELGSDYRSISLTYGGAVYVEMPYLRHHVLALRIAGGYAWSDFQRRGYYNVGGYPDEDIVMDLVNRVRFSSVALRGYRPGTAWGDQFYLVNAEYRLPILNIFRGTKTLPWQFNRLFMSVFTDTGGAFPRTRARWDGLLTSVGAEVYLTMTLGHWEGAIFKLGYARGLMKTGIDDVYLVMASPF
jgi:Tol biopolymer transport system component